MKVLMKSIEMIAWFTEDGIPIPIKYKMLCEDNSYLTIKVDSILFREQEKLAGNRMIKFTCQSTVNEVQRRYELKYELDTCKWFLFKM